MIISMGKAKAMLDSGRAVFRGHCEETGGLSYAVVDDLEKQIACHVCDPNHLFETLYNRVDRGQSK